MTATGYRCPGGCRTPVDDPRTVCPACVTLFGDYLAPATSDITAAEFTATAGAAAARVAAVMADRAAGRIPPPRDTTRPATPPPGDVEWKQNQRCWVCTERHTCRRDPDSTNGWICSTCLELPGPGPITHTEVSHP